MIRMRPSVPEDIPRQRELWGLAFGDDGAYVDNFYQHYYRPERVLVLEEDGVIQSMTAWFDTVFDTADGNRWKTGYLYAVATHPDARGRGYAGMLLKYADFYLKEEAHCQAVTTVPADEGLHRFFGANGFRECFTHQCVTIKSVSQAEKEHLESISPARYGELREKLLKGQLHIAYSTDALEYQAGCCRVSGGGLYLIEKDGPVILCAEGMADGRLLIKEMLGAEQDVKAACDGLMDTLPQCCGTVRIPGEGSCFGMLKWLYPGLEKCWDWSKTAYMGLGFD